MSKQTIAGDWGREFDIPESVTICPSCETRVTAYVDGWTVDDDNEKIWIATSVNTDCQTEPLKCLEHGKYLTQSDWMEHSQKVLDYLNGKYRWRDVR